MSAQSARKRFVTRDAWENAEFSDAPVNFAFTGRDHGRAIIREPAIHLSRGGHMALKDRIPFGMSLPHRGYGPLPMPMVRQVAERAEALGFRDLWVTENTLDHVFSFDPIIVLTYAAAVTTRIRVGLAVAVLPLHDPRLVAHQVATLDYVSGGRAIYGAGIGRDAHYAEFQVPRQGRVRRFREAIELMRALWTTEGKVDYRGSIFRLEGGSMPIKPVQKPMPVWLGGGHPDAIARAASLADGWMGAGGSSTADFQRSVPLLRQALEKAGRDPTRYPISKRVFIAVDTQPARARAQLERWYTEVYHNPPGTDASGVHGTPEQVRQKLEDLVGMGANHLLLNPVAEHAEQLEALAAVVGLKP
jgi:probable F420-dependent oxidoreductase